jgi:ATP synthase protein I
VDAPYNSAASPGLRRVAWSVVLAQAVLTALVALLCFVLWGPRAALSAAIGGGIAVAAGATLALVVFGGSREAALADVLRAFYAGEAAKVGVTIVLFAVVLATMKKMLVPGALFGAFAASFLVHWIVLPRAMRRLDGMAGSVGGQAGNRGQ